MLAGKVVVITGASSGIGLAVAKRAVAEGARVVVAARSEAKLQDLVRTDLGGDDHALAVRCDVRVRADHAHLLDASLTKFGKVDAWINNAGVGITRTVLELTDDDFDAQMDINVRSVLIGMQTVIPYFKEQKAGHVINVSSLLGRLPHNASIRSMYCACKAAVNSLTVNARCDLRAEYPDVMVSLFSPGVVATPFGLNAMHGGMDSTKIPHAQPVDDVAGLIVEQLVSKQADVYSRDMFREAVGAYYSAVDCAVIEAQGPSGR
jgi:NAD(P)-dependent dehydrogenase (short-subunit alcohol dehydrogenase family)